MHRLSLHSIMVAFIGLALVAVAGLFWYTDSRPEYTVTISNLAQATIETTPTPATTATAVPAQTVTGQNNQPAPNGIGDEYLALGDSVAYGVGAPTPGELGYAGLFYNNYLKRAKPGPLIYQNFAIPGETSDSFFQIWRGGKSQLQRALDEIETAQGAGKKVSPITLTLGGNDMLGARQKSESERNAALNHFEINLNKALDALQQKTGDKTDFIVTTYYNPYAYLTGGDDSETAWVRRFNDSIRQIAAAHNARVADFFTPVFKQESNLTWIRFGDVHPTGTGYTVLAKALWQAAAYDRNGPKLSLSYNGLPAGRKITAGERLSFKLAAEDDIVASNQADIQGAGSVPGVNVTLDDQARPGATAVPGRLLANKAIPEFTFLLDTAGMTPGSHHLRFEAADMAGNTSSLEISFEVAG